MNNFEIKLFQVLVDDFTDCFMIDNARNNASVQSEVETLAEKCTAEGLTLGYIALARKAAAIEGYNGRGAQYA